MAEKQAKNPIEAILENAKEYVAKKDGYAAFRFIEPDLTEEYLHRAAIHAISQLVWNQTK